MKWSNKLRQILIRLGWMFGTLLAYTMLVDQLYFAHYTLCGIILFLGTWLLIRLNLQPLAKSVRQLVSALFVLTYASVVFWHKVEYLPWPMYRNVLVYTPLGFVLTAPLLPVFLGGIQANRLINFTKTALFMSLFWLDFAVAFPNVAFADADSEGIYMGAVPAEPGEPGSVKLRTFAFGSQRFYGFNDVEDIHVLTPTDNEGRMYESRIYRHRWDSEIMVDTLTCDTIWLRERGIWGTYPRKTMENVELAALRHTWQYAMWHRFKRMLGYEKEESRWSGADL